MFRTFITIASNDLPTHRLPTLFSRLHACASPGVRSQRKADIVSGLDANESLFDSSSGEVIATTLAATDAYWMAARIEGGNPPETLVPRLTCESGKVRGVRQAQQWRIGKSHGVGVDEEFSSGVLRHGRPLPRIRPPVLSRHPPARSA